MKKILLTQRLTRHERTGEIRDCLDVNWARLLHALDMIAIPFPSECRPEEFLGEVPCDGLILTGGNDLGSVNSDPLSLRRDAVEKELLRIFLAAGLPIVGVCRGMQLIADAFGMGIDRVAGHVGTRTALCPEPASAYLTQLQAIPDVNSYHDFAVSRIGAPFILTATSPDGIIKAMESSAQKVFCQMWHSEREAHFVPAQLEILKRALSA